MTGFDWLDSLDPEQRAAVESEANFVLVRAGAGTGKTRTLVARILHLLTVKRVPPHKITIITFTNKAAREVRSRIAAVVAPEQANQLMIGTFHSIGARILRRHAAYLGLPHDFRILDPDASDQIVQDTVMRLAPPVLEANGELQSAYRDSMTRLAGEASSRIRIWKNQGIMASAAIQDIERREAGPDTDDLRRIAVIYDLYEEALFRRGMADFGDLVLKAVYALLDPDIATLEESRIEHLLVDEAQDTNRIQLELLLRLRRHPPFVFVVGDEDQSIFSFQGGSSDSMLQVTSVRADDDNRYFTGHFTLTRNRRSTDEILKPAVELVSWNERQAPKHLSSGLSGPRPKVRLFQTDLEEANALARACAYLLGKGIPSTEIAVLVRSSWVISPIEEAFVRAEIPYEIIGGTLLAAREEVKTLASYLFLAINPNDDIAFRYVCNRPTRGLGPAAEQAIINAWATLGVPFHDVCRRVDRLDGLRITPTLIQGLKGLSHGLQQLSIRSGLQEQSASDLLEFVLGSDGLGYEDYLTRTRQGSKLRRCLDMIDTVRRLAFDAPDVRDFLEKLTLATDLDTPPVRDRIRISTIHSAKGLEWDHVFCPCFEQGVIPAPRSSARKAAASSLGDPLVDVPCGTVEEERRLAHVAFTRARRTLFVSACRSRQKSVTGPSVFLAESGLDELLPVDFGDVRRSTVFGSKAKGHLGRKGFTRIGR